MKISLNYLKSLKKIMVKRKTIGMVNGMFFKTYHLNPFVQQISRNLDIFGTSYTKNI